ncbi:MAG: hypothetical protein GY854_14835 [Deltaproteobacteria bacterium]|nr:hypothetical protein [Deltaproteobacteria bacterium]
MRQKTIKLAVALTVAMVCLTLVQEVRANKLDLSLARFVDCNVDGTICNPDVVEYEKFLAEYAFGLSPRILVPAETLGYSGFYLGLEGSLTPRPDTKGSAARWKKGTVPATEHPDVMFVPAVRVRKGLPWSFEIGGTLNYLAQSELVGLGGDIKWSLFEGYRRSWRGALPDIAARGSITRIIGEADVDMTIVALDASMSYAFGIGGMVTLTPWLGFQYIWTIVRVEPLIYRDDSYSTPTFHPPTGDEYKVDTLSGPNLGRAKLFAGFRFGYEMLTFSFELGWGIKSDWKAETEAKEKVAIGHQIQVSGGVGIDF